MYCVRNFCGLCWVEYLGFLIKKSQQKEKGGAQTRGSKSNSYKLLIFIHVPVVQLDRTIAS